MSKERDLTQPTEVTPETNAEDSAPSEVGDRQKQSKLDALKERVRKKLEKIREDDPHIYPLF
ncbi:MAG: hypothetical protein KDD62_10425 [Bdellovibrionales bacterium]|nr:hypothetical protein [Bdellovibrionales bacterium]